MIELYEVVNVANIVTVYFLSERKYIFMWIRLIFGVVISSELAGVCF